MMADSQDANFSITEPGPPITLEQLDAIESMIGARLPTSLRDFLLRFNGGRPVPSTFEVPDHEERLFDVHLLYGISREIETSNIGWYHQEMRGAFGRGRVAIGCTDTDDQILVDLNDGSIWFWDYSEPDPSQREYRVADDHAAFLSSLRNVD